MMENDRSGKSEPANEFDPEVIISSINEKLDELEKLVEEGEKTAERLKNHIRTKETLDTLVSIIRPNIYDN